MEGWMIKFTITFSLDKGPTDYKTAQAKNHKWAIPRALDGTFENYFSL